MALLLVIHEAGHYVAARVFGILGMLSAAMCAFNLLPFPFLDGGRLVFLGVEAGSGRKSNPKIEGWVHAVGLLMLLTFSALATYGDIVAR